MLSHCLYFHCGSGHVRPPAGGMSCRPLGLAGRHVPAADVKLPAHQPQAGSAPQASHALFTKHGNLATASDGIQRYLRYLALQLGGESLKLQLDAPIT